MVFIIKVQIYNFKPQIYQRMSVNRKKANLKLISYVAVVAKINIYGNN